MRDCSAGIDLASEEHRLVAVGGDGRRIEERRYAHSEEGVSMLVRRLLELDVARVAIEQPNGLVVDRLLEAGIAVVAVHPNQLAAARDRYRSGGGKSDGFDAYLLAELARTDMHRLRLLEPDGDQTKALRTLTRAREELVEPRVRLGNQLRAQLEAFWPGAARVFAEVDSPICLVFLERYPSPGDSRDRQPTSNSLEAIAGQALVAVESGKKKVACFRWACNKNLRDAVSVLADSSRKHNPWAADIYQRARARGHDYPHAIRILGRAWLRVIWRMWQDQTPYDPARHGNLNRLLATEG
jgi:transposase